MPHDLTFSNTHQDLAARDEDYVLGWRFEPRIIFERGEGTQLFDVDGNASLLHDVVEDTDHTVDDIRAEFGDDVADLGACTSRASRYHQEHGRALHASVLLVQ